MCETWRVTGRPSKSRQLHAVGSEDRHVAVGQEEHVLRVARIAGTSEATKYSLSPKPMTTGGP